MSPPRNVLGIIVLLSTIPFFYRKNHKYLINIKCMILLLSIQKAIKNENRINVTLKRVNVNVYKYNIVFVYRPL